MYTTLQHRIRALGSRVQLTISTRLCCHITLVMKYASRRVPAWHIYFNHFRPQQIPCRQKLTVILCSIVPFAKKTFDHLMTTINIGLSYNICNYDRTMLADDPIASLVLETLFVEIISSSIYYYSYFYIHSIEELVFLYFPVHRSLNPKEDKERSRS